MYGIDLGTSYVRMAEFSRRRAQPVAISWDDDEDDSEELVRIQGMNIHIGDDISWPLFSESNTMAFGPMCLLGRKYDQSVKNASKFWNFKVVNVEGKPHIECKKGMETVQVQPETIVIEILAKLKSLAEKRRTKKEDKEGSKDKFVIAVPGCYTYAQRRAVLFAAAQAEMEVEYLINNTTAIAMTQMVRPENRKRVIIDVGAGSFTISAISIEKDKLKVLSTVGENDWGGDDVNKLFTSYCIEKYATAQKKGLRPKELDEVIRRCQVAKHQLYDNTFAIITLPIGSCKLEKVMFQAWNSDLLDHVSGLLERCLIEAEIDPDEEKDLRVTMVGGTCQLREIENIVVGKFKDNKSCVVENLFLDRHLVACGAALMAGYFSGEYNRLIREVEEVTPLLGVTNRDGRVCEVIPYRSSLNIASSLTSSISVATGTSRACKVDLQVYEQERSYRANYVFLGGISLDLPENQGGAEYDIKVTFKVEKNTFLVTVTELTTETSIDILISHQQGLQKYGPCVQELKPLEIELPPESDTDEEDRESSPTEIQKCTCPKLQKHGTDLSAKTSTRRESETSSPGSKSTRSSVQHICDSCNVPIADSSDDETEKSDSRLCKQCADLLTQNAAKETESLPNTDKSAAASTPSDNDNAGFKSNASCQTEDESPSSPVEDSEGMRWTSEPGDIVPFSNTDETPWPYQHKDSAEEKSSSQAVSKRKPTSKLYVHDRIKIPCTLHEDHLQNITRPKIVLAENDYVFGIDLGTTSIQLGYVHGADAELVPYYPTVKYCAENLVKFEEGTMIIGDNYECDIFDRDNILPCEILRLLGRRYGSHVREITKFWPYPVVNVNGWPHITFKHEEKDVTISPETVLSEILKEIKLFLKKVYCKKKEPVVAITVPSACTYVQKRAVMKAARQAGFRVPYLVNDTTALVLFKRHKLFTGTCVIIHLGGGSLTISAFKVTHDKIKVLSTVGDNNWGGHDLDNSIIAHCHEIFKQNGGTEMSSEDLKALRLKCVKAKHELTTKRETKIDIPDCHEPCSITREDFENWNFVRFKQLSDLLSRCLWEARIDPKTERPEKVQVILHGGSTQVPKVREIVQNCFAVHENVKTSYRLRNTAARKPETTADITTDFRKIGKNAKGAAILAAMETGIAKFIDFWPKDVELCELAPQLGLRTAFGNFSEVIPRSYFPMCKYKSYVVDTKYEGDVRIHVFERERNYMSEYDCVGGVCLKFPPEIGVVYLIITFCVDQHDFVFTVADSKWKQVRAVLMSEKFGDPELTDSAGRILLHPREPMCFVGWVGRSVSIGPENEERRLKEDDKISSPEWSLINVKLCFCSPYKTSRFEIVRNVPRRSLPPPKNKVFYVRDQYGTLQTTATNVESMLCPSIPTVVIGISPEFVIYNCPDVSKELQGISITERNQVSAPDPRGTETHAPIEEVQKSATANSENQNISVDGGGQRSLADKGDSPSAKETHGTITDIPTTTSGVNDNFPNVISNISRVSITEEKEKSLSPPRDTDNFNNGKGLEASTACSGVTTATDTGDKQKVVTDKVSDATIEMQSISVGGRSKKSLPGKGDSLTGVASNIVASIGGKLDRSDENARGVIKKVLREESQEPLSVLRDTKNIRISDENQPPKLDTSLSADANGKKQESATESDTDANGDILKPIPGEGPSSPVKETEVLSKSKKRRSRKRKSLQAKTASESTKDASKESSIPSTPNTGKKKRNKKEDK
uniref:Uncharacterized protein n=1 Tax=Homalodisca liturata TaxID=320908 RepID=A0A1B6HEA0_9HEMI